MKRLSFALILALLAGWALAASGSSQHKWQVNYPDPFVYVWINVDALVFDLDDDSAEGSGYVNGVLAGKAGYQLASLSNLEACVGADTSGSSPVPATDDINVITTLPTSNCQFAPEIDIDLSSLDSDTQGAYDFSAIGYGGSGTGDLQAVNNGDATTAVADATVLFATWPSTTWDLTISQSGTLEGATVDIYLGYWDSADGRVEDRNGNAVSVVHPGASIDETSSNYWYVNGYPYMRAVPMLFGLTLDGSSSTDSSAVLVYTVSAP